MMRFFWVFSLIAVLTSDLYAQSTKKIIVWERSDLESTEATKKVIELNEHGQKIKVYREESLPLEVYFYDEEGRLIKKSSRGAFGNDYIETFTYQDGVNLLRTTYYIDPNQPKKYLTYEYFNEKEQVTERKEYENKGGNLTLKEWRQFFYDSKGRLLSERLVLTESEKESYLPLTKVAYEYRETDGKLKQITEYSHERILNQTTFQYDEEGRLLEKAYDDLIYGHAWVYTNFFYEEGVLQQTRKMDIYTIEEQIFKNDKLIRVKIFDNRTSTPELTYVGDYQYVE